MTTGARMSPSFGCLPPAEGVDRAGGQERPEQGAKPAFSLSDAEFDPATKTMRSYYKSRGVGDCSTIGEWRWSGNDFRLVRYWSKPKCDGNPFEDTRRWQVFPPRR